MRKGTVGAIVLGVVMIAALICVGICTERVPAGYVGVVYNMNGGIEGDTLSQGWHVISPTKNVTLYSIGIEQSYLTTDSKGDSPKDESFSIPTSDGKTVRVNLEFSYRFDATRVSDTFVQFKGKSGEQIKETFIKPKIIAWTQEVSANYPVADIFGDKRTKINAELDVYLREKFDKYGIIIDTVNFTEAETDRIKAEKDRQIAQINAERDKEVAQIEADKKLIAAQADADALKIAADAEADANKKIAASLTPELIEKIKYEKWDGSVPKVSGGSTPIVDIGSIE